MLGCQLECRNDAIAAMWGTKFFRVIAQPRHVGSIV